LFGCALLVVIVVAGLVIRSGCSNGDQKHAPLAAQDDPATRIPVQKNWRFTPGNPILRLGDLRPLATWNDPCVLKNGAGYVMYLTTALKQPGAPPVQPFRAVSSDGLKWRLEPETPLLEPGPANAFDAASIETPSVVRFRDRYHLYYTGVGKGGLGGTMSIGHAVSKDGLHWARDPIPVLQPTGKQKEWNGLQVAEPGAVVFRDRLYLYFAAVGLREGGKPPVRRVIGLAVSENGRDFGPPTLVLEPGDLYPPSRGFDGYSTPAAAVIGGKMHLFFDVGLFLPDTPHPWTQVALHHAVSSDGRNAWKQDEQAILTRHHAPWTALEVRAPAPLVDGDRLRLWFAGNADHHDFVDEVRAKHRTALFGIGHAERPIPR
jgi:predicted GH43/DUF377 family glycosyl hydrolase